MNEVKVIEYEVPRKTLIRGHFTGKFRGILNNSGNSLSSRALLYDIEIYETEIKITGFEKNFNERDIDSLSELPLSKLPNECNCELQTKEGKSIYSKLKIHNPCITNTTITNVLKEGNISFGLLKGTISGYIIDSVKVKEEILEGNSTNKLEGKIQLLAKEKTDENKKLLTKKSSLKFKDLISSIPELVGFLIAAYLIICFILLIGWQGIVGLFFIGAIALILKYLPFIFNIFFWGLRALFFVLLFYGLWIVVTKDYNPTINSVPLEAPEEVSTITEYYEKDPKIVSDSIISHHRVWKDYDENMYSGDLKVFKSDFFASRDNRAFFASNISSEIEIAILYKHLLYFDENKLEMVVNFFDSLRLEKQLSRIEFANCLVSCIQDIPYVLILEGPCSHTEYNDHSFVRNYLLENGPCKDFVKFGIHTPLEFIGSLKGDCDTRTLLLYLLFRRFNYDVVILGSTIHQHAVLGMNLPSYGVFKWHDNKKYFVWETTSPGFELGVFPAEISNMNDWSVILPININF